jgi:hypothetical protein
VSGWTADAAHKISLSSEYRYLPLRGECCCHETRSETAESTPTRTIKQLENTNDYDLFRDSTS